MNDRLMHLINWLMFWIIRKDRWLAENAITSPLNAGNRFMLWNDKETYKLLQKKNRWLCLFNEVPWRSTIRLPWTSMKINEDHVFEVDTNITKVCWEVGEQNARIWQSSLQHGHLRYGHVYFVSSNRIWSK